MTGHQHSISSIVLNGAYVYAAVYHNTDDTTITAWDASLEKPKVCWFRVV